MKRSLFLITLFSALLFPGYLISTGGYYTVGNNGDAVLKANSALCENIVSREATVEEPLARKELNPDKITLLSWNSYKGSIPGWLDNFARLLQDADLITLQEGYMTDSLVETLDANDYSWDIASAFTLDTMPTGVLTASKATPSALCATWDKEPILSLPKTAMTTEYRIKNRPDTLMLVNIHMVNFTLGTKSFANQLEKIEKIILQHRGPVILAGDFNTWSEARLTLLQNLTARTGLTQLSFTADHRTQFFGKVLDHIYSRGLRIIETHTVESEYSDHNPLLATFAYPQPQIATDDSAHSTSM